MISRIKKKAHDTLRWSEKYTKTDMAYLASGGFWLGVGQVISALASFFLTIAFANLLPKESFGTYQYVLATAGILTTATLSGMGTAIARASARGFEGAMMEGLRVRSYWGLLGGVGSLGFAVYYYIQGDITLFLSFLVAGVFLPIMDPLAVFNSYLQGKKYFHLYTGYAAFFQIGRVTSMATVLFLTDNVVLVIFTYFISTTLLRFVLLSYTLRNYIQNNNVDPGAISYGKHLSTMELIGVLTAQLDKVLIWHYLGAVPLAVYSFALSPVIRLQSLFRFVETLSLPKLSTKDPELIKKTLPHKMRQFYFIMVLATLSYIIAAPLIYKILFPQYLDSVAYSQIFSVILLFVPQKVTGTAFTLHGKKESLYWFSLMAPLSKIFALFILLPLYGLGGAVIAMIVPYLVNFFAIRYFFNRL